MTMKNLKFYLLTLCIILVSISILGGCEHTCEFGEWEPVTEATCTKEGTAIKTCSKCGQSLTKTIHQKSHTWENGVCKICAKTCQHSYNEWRISKLASCKSTGTMIRNCTKCNKLESQTTPLESHQWENGICKNCSTSCEHSTKQGSCNYCGLFINLLSSEYDKIRTAKNEIASLVQQTTLTITFGGKLNIDNCNSITKQIGIIREILADNPQDFKDFSNNFSLLRSQWNTFVSNANSTSSSSARISYWNTFKAYYLNWQSTDYSICQQYYPK